MPEEKQDAAQKAFEIYKQLIGLTQKVNLEFLKIGEFLYLLSLDNAFQKLNPECASFDEFIADPEIGLSRTDAYDCRKIYGLFVLKCAVDPVRLAKIGKAKLAIIARHVRERELEELFYMAESLSKSDLLDELPGRRGKKDPGQFGPRQFLAVREAGIDENETGLSAIKADRPAFLQDAEGHLYVRVGIEK